MNSKNNLYLYFLAVFLIIVSSLSAEKNSEKLSFDFGITRTKEINLWPIVSYYESSDTTEVKVDLAFSLFRYNLDRKINRQYSHLIPIYWDNDAIEKRDFRLLSLYYPSFFRYIQDRENETTSWRFGEIAPQINLIKYTKSKDGSYLENNLFFLLWIFRNPDFSTTTLLPLFSKGTYHYNLKSYEIISPLYWHFKSDDYDNKILFPLMWKLKNQDYSLLTIPPLYWKIKKHNSQMNILLPFWYLYSDTTPGAEYSSNTIFPIYWHRKNTQYQSLTISPIFSYGFSPDKKREHLMITPLYWKMKKHNSQMNILLPFWYLYSDTTPGAKYSSNTIFPIYWHRKNTQYQSLTISPIFSYGFSPDKKREHLMVTPLYWKINRPNYSQNSLIPLWWKDQNKVDDLESSRLFTLSGYWRIKKGKIATQGIFPIWWSLANKDTISGYQDNYILPLFNKALVLCWNLTNKDTISSYQDNYIFYLFSFSKNSAENRSYFTITPLFIHTREEGGFSNSLFPIWWQRRIGTGESQTYDNLIWPIYFRTQNRNYKNLTIFPLFSKGKSTDDSSNYLAITPLFWNIKNENRHQIILWPLIKRETNPNLSYFRLTPFIWYKNTPEKSYFSLQPFFYIGENNEFKTFNILWQIYNQHHYYGKKNTISLFFRLLYLEKHINGDNEFKILHKLFVNSEVAGEVEKTFFPFYSFKKNNNGEKTISMFLNFYHYSKKRIGNSQEFYHEEKIFWFMRLRSNYDKLVEEGKIIPLKN